MKHLFCINHLYLDGKPFAQGYNLGDLGYILRFVNLSGGLSQPVHFRSYLSFVSLFGSISRRISLGVPFPVNSSDSDVK